MTTTTDPPAPTATGVSHTPTVGRFVGQSVHRKEDPRLITGHGRYVDDIILPGMLHAAFVRSDLPRARLTRVDTAAALALDGVVAVLTGADLNPILAGDMHATVGLGFGAPLQPLAGDDVRFVGDPIALVVAESRYVAEDAAELVEVDYDAMEPVLDMETAAASDEIVHPERDTNVAGYMATEPNPALDEAFANAAHVFTETFRQQRQTQVPMETRGVIASWEPHGAGLEVWISTQVPHECRMVCSRITGVPEHRVRVRMGDVGGGFGLKAYMCRDEQTVVLAAFHLGRTIKWIEDRRENLIASNTARLERITVDLAVDEEGRLLAARLDQIDDAGTFPVMGTGGAAAFGTMMFTGPYRMPQVGWTTTSVYTNTCGRGPYRGPWQIETSAREQIMDIAARGLGIDPLELRRRNVLQRDELPHLMPSGIELEHISPAETLEQAAAIVGYDEFRAEQRAALEQGRYLGLGISLYVEPQPGMGPYGIESVNIRIHPDGKVDVFQGSGSHGQGLETTTAQVVAEHLGVHIDDITVHQGDTQGTPYAFGTGGSRSGPILGAAARQAALELREKVLAFAAELLEASADDLELADSVVSVRGTPARSVTLTEVAAMAYLAGAPQTDAAPVLEVASRYKAPPFMFSNACHIATCEVDIETGKVELLRYVVSEDCGVMINPAIVEGQIAGGVVQGIGSVLHEHMVYDDYGNPLTATLLDYGIPLASDVPIIEFGHLETPASTPGGYKGVGEGGAIGAPPAVINAINDAVAPLGARFTDLPIDPSAVTTTLSPSM